MRLEFSSNANGSIYFDNLYRCGALGAASAERVAQLNRAISSAVSDGFIKAIDLVDALEDRCGHLTNPAVHRVEMEDDGHIRVEMSIPMFNNNGYQEADFCLTAVIPTTAIDPFGFCNGNLDVRGWHPTMRIKFECDDVRWAGHRGHDDYLKAEYAAARAEIGIPDDEDLDIDWSPTFVDADYPFEVIDSAVTRAIMEAVLDPSWVYRNAKGPLGDVTDRTWDEFAARTGTADWIGPIK